MEETKWKVIKYLEDKNYLIVLDDLSNKSEWDKIETMLPRSFKSRIIVTTQLESLAKFISHPDNIYKIKALSHDDGKYLFFKAVYKNSMINFHDESKSNMEYDPSSSEILNEEDGELQNQCMMIYPVISRDMETVADQIIETCGHFPLAIVTVGSFLATKGKYSEEWRAMLCDLRTELDSNPDLGPVKAALRCSYDLMPDNLKSCMLYLSVFHNHHEIRRTRIIRRWMAHGYVIGNRYKRAEELGKGYFFDLLGRNLIQPSQMTTIVNRDCNSCTINEVMYESILEKFVDENVGSMVEDENHIAMTDEGRNLVISGEQSNEHSILSTMKLSHMRSLSIFGKVGDNLRLLKMLRVLDLEGTVDLDNRDIKAVGKLHLLKYLGLRGTRITKLPKSFRKLYDLETLDIRNTGVVQLPAGITKLQKLSYLRAGHDLYNNPELAIMCPLALPVRCRLWLVKQPVEIKNFGSYGVRVPRGIRELWRSLFTLGMVDIRESEVLAKEMQYLTKLRKLAVTGFSRKNGETLANVIDRLNMLNSLVLAAVDYEGLSCCLEAVSSPPKYLDSLKLYSPIGKLPDWIKRLENLVKMELRYTELEMEEIKKIENLPNLTILRMLKNSFKGEQLCFGPGAFPKLQVLIIERLETLTSVSFEKSTMPRLGNLEINRCGSLAQGGLSGLDILPRLKEVLVKYKYFEEPEKAEFNEKIQALEIELRHTLSGHRNKPNLRVIKC